MAGAAGEEKIGQGISRLRAVQIQGVLEVGLEVELDGRGFVVFRGRLDRDLLRQFFDPRIQLGQLQIRVHDRLGKHYPGDTQMSRRHGRNDRGSHVADLGFVVQRIGQRPGGVNRQFALAPVFTYRLGVIAEPPFQAPDPWRDKDRIGSDGLHQHRVAHFVKIAGGQRHGVELIHAG